MITYNHLNNTNRYQYYKQYKLLYEIFLFLLGYYCFKKNDINFIEFLGELVN